MKGGGHAMAAGVTCARGVRRVPRLYGTHWRRVETVATCQRVFVDGAVRARGVTTELAATLDRAGPFGSGNPEPVLALPSHQVVYADEVGQAHMRRAVQIGRWLNRQRHRVSIDRAEIGERADAHRGQALHVAGSLALDRWQGTERVQLRVLDVAVPDQGPAVIR